VTRRILIADAGPLIALASVESLYLLHRLFGGVTVTPVVYDEILPTNAVFADAKLLATAFAEGWIEVMEVPNSDYMPLNPGVDPGEASSIRLACGYQELGDHVLIVMDDRAGRLEAKSRGLAVLGSAALIGLAKTEGLIPAARPLLEKMVESGYFIGPSIVSAVLADVGE
jgi:predicted nucleic acid-binding protein